MANRPGTMFYFADWRPVIGAVSEKQGWELVTAILQYAETGERREIGDPIVKMLFSMMAEKVDRDDIAYREKCRQREYAVYCRECDRRGEPRLDYAEWVDHREISTDINRYQPYPIGTGNGTATANGTAEAEGKSIVSPAGEGMATGEGERERTGEKERLAELAAYEQKRQAAIDRLKDYK